MQNPNELPIPDPRKPKQLSTSEIVQISILARDYSMGIVRGEALAKYLYNGHGNA